MSLYRRGGRGRDPAGASQQMTQPSTPTEFAQQAEYLIPAEVRMISGCHSEQTSADVTNVRHCTDGKLPEPAGRSGGACTSALLALLYEEQGKPLTFQKVLLDLRKRLTSTGFSQIPQLSSSRRLELEETPFSLSGSGQGVKRALLVGINYCGQSGRLAGCHYDALNMKKYLIERQGYSEEHILLLLDDGEHHYPTREKIIRALRQLVAQSVSGDSVYFHYSGHGGLLDADWGNVFKQGKKEYDETVYPVDHSRSGQIRDFSLFNHFVKPMPAGVTVTCVMDCCHSGSVLDLPYKFQPTPAGTIRMQRNMDALTNLAFLYILAGGMLPFGGLFEGIGSAIENVTGGALDSFQGTGLDEMTNDTTAVDWDPGTDGFEDDVDEADNFEDNEGFEDVGDYGDTEGYEDARDYGDSGGFDADAGDMGNGDYADFGVFDTGQERGGDFGGGDTNIMSSFGGGDGDAGGFLGGDGADFDAGDGDVDCGCLGDVLGALLEE